MDRRHDKTPQSQARSRDHASAGSPGKVSMTGRAQRSAGVGSGGLPEPVQAKMEAAFGADFSNVRVHEGDDAAAIGADAYASGEDLHFAPGKYDPDSEQGQALIGHELAHVEQQRTGRVGGDGLVVDAGLEHEADDLGARAARGETVASAGGGAKEGSTGGIVQGSGIKQAALPAVPVAGATLGVIAADIWAWAGVEATATSVSTLLSIAGAGSGLIGGIGTAIQPGASGVQDYCIQPWQGPGTEEALAQIIQVRLINKFVEMWIAQNGPKAQGTEPGAPVTGAPVTGAPVTGPVTGAPVTDAPVTGAPVPGPSPSPTPDPTAPTGPEIDPALVEMIKEAVRLDVTKRVKEEVAEAVKTLSSSPPYLWEDGGIPGLGTSCEIRWKNIKAYRFGELLEFTKDALAIPAIKASGLHGKLAEIKGVIRGDLIKGKWHMGLGDALAVNVHSQSIESNGVWVNTRWDWDGNSTYMTLGVSVGKDGTPECEEISREIPGGGKAPDDCGWGLW
jgi:hypothetical protein